MNQVETPKILLGFSGEESHTLAGYQQRGGYEALKKMLRDFTPEAVIEEVKKSGLRGRGGAGFPAGVKWGFLPKNSAKPIYLLCNADEGEPGTFKDRLIMEKNPHQLVEGMILAAYAIRAAYTYCYIRGEYALSRDRMRQAVDEAYAAGYLGDRVLGKEDFNCHIAIHEGAGAYICGDETGLMNSLEGKKGYPRIKPPFPAVSGVFGCPTIINNVETLAAVPWIMINGGAAYASLGTEKSTGTKLFSVSGHVNKPGVYEVVLGKPLRDFIADECGGVLAGANIKAVIPGGSSVPVLTASEVEKVNLDYESCKENGTMLGSGGVIVMAEGTCMVKALSILTRFYHHESCGQCTPCREGTSWMENIINRIEKGQGSLSELDKLLAICKTIEFNTICPLGDAAVGPVRSFIQKFRSEFEEHIHQKKCPFGNRLGFSRHD